jgi:hypothetical protein
VRRARAAAAVLLMLAACFGPDPNQTESGKGLPVLSVEFPESVAAGSTNTATLTVENPGPGDIESVVVAFAAVGVAAASGPLPAELVPAASGRDNPAVASVEPEPRSVSPDGVVYVFDGLEEGASLEIAFRIVAPERAGTAANSISVYDGADASRIRGLRVDTVVTG